MRMLSDNSPADDDSSTEPLLVTPAGGATLLPPAAGVGGSASASAGVVYPDSNTVVILAALLCVLVCALGLNSLFRCARHCGGRGGGLHARAAVTMAVAAHPPAAAVVVGLDKRELRKIPVVEYETTTDKAAGTDECAICLGEFVDGEKVRVLPGCRHGFHVTCIDGWLAAHSSCPICRNSLLVDEDRAAGAGEGTTVQRELEAT